MAQTSQAPGRRAVSRVGGIYVDWVCQVEQSYSSELCELECSGLRGRGDIDGNQPAGWVSCYSRAAYWVEAHGHLFFTLRFLVQFDSRRRAMIVGIRSGHLGGRAVAIEVRID